MGKSWGVGKDKPRVKKSEHSKRQGNNNNDGYNPPPKNKYKHGYVIEE